MEIIYNSPEDYLLDDAADELEDAMEDIFENNGSDIDYIGNISDEEVDEFDYDPEDEVEYYTNNVYVDLHNDNTIEYEIPCDDDDCDDDDDDCDDDDDDCDDDDDDCDDDDDDCDDDDDDCDEDDLDAIEYDDED